MFFDQVFCPIPLVVWRTMQTNKKIIHLNRPNYGLLVVPGIWRELLEFSSGAICLVLASLKYNESDYIRIYDEFKLKKFEK